MLLGDRWELGEVLGRGASSAVHLGTDVRTGEACAIKLLRTDEGVDGSRFEREIGILRSLDHPAVVRHLDHGTHDGVPYLVIEHVGLGSLSDLLRTGALAPDRVVRIGVDLAGALWQAHGLGVVHRDVKPANVLVAPDGRVKLADFGVAWVAGAARFTATGWSVGTIAYLAPEQARGESTTTASDVYSLGLVLLECLTGERAFPGAGMPALLERLDRLPAIPASVPPRLRAVIAAMTALDPDDRPSARTAADLLGVALDPDDATADLHLTLVA